MKKEYLLIIIIFLFCSCSETMLWKNYDIVRGPHNNVLSESEEIEFHTNFESNLETSNFFGNVYGNSYNYEFFITIKSKDVYENIEKIKLNKLSLSYNETEKNSLNIDDINIRYPCPGNNNKKIVEIFKNKNEIPLIIPSKKIEFSDYGLGMYMGLFFNNIEIDFDKTEKLIMKFDIQVFKMDGEINEYKFELFYEKNIEKYKIARFTA